MNARIAFDTHAFVKRLEAAGMSVPQAEALADAMGDIVLQSITTKADLREVDLGLRAEMKELSASLRAEMNEFRKELKDLELRLTLRMLGMTAATIAILASLKILG
ncbi:MAG: hypothetical protein QOG72_2341 [Sphingomonadales bacterium]|jgi:hypothetical protein|nr:hypothetical protein [Sphingomonadales bacterium]